MHDPSASDRMTQMRDPFVGAILDRRFRVDEKIAVGGFGAIYRATHVKSHHEVALKILHPRMASDARIVARFRREGATLTNLRSQYTVAVYELVEDGSNLFIVMELLHGQTLQQVFQAHGRLPWRRMVSIARAVCYSLVEAHALGIVHRDLKPANIHLGTDDTVKVLDFGIAKLVQAVPGEHGGEDLTRANELVGTFDYVSPEQIAGDSYSGRSDLYTLGIVVYEMITGQRPFGQVRGPALLTMIVTETPPPPSTHVPELPDELDRVLLRCLERDPGRRFANAGDLAAAFEGMLAGPAEAQQRHHPDEEATVLDNRTPAIFAPYATGEIEPIRELPPRSRPPEPLLVEPAPRSIHATLDGWQAPPIVPTRPPSQPAFKFTPYPPPPIVVPAARGIPTAVWVGVLLLAVVLGVVLAALV
ncbi:MAG: serine/threonine-protein kinase [Kofleriaceae bacterium]